MICPNCCSNKSKKVNPADNDLNCISSIYGCPIRCDVCKYIFPFPGEERLENKKSATYDNRSLSLNDIKIQLGYIDTFIKDIHDMLHMILDIKNKSIEALENTDGKIVRDNGRFNMDVRDSKIFESINKLRKAFELVTEAKSLILQRK